MKIIRCPELSAASLPPCAATIGFFDGVHRGHQFLIERVKVLAKQRGLASAVVTFAKHPRMVMDSAYQPLLLSTYAERMALLAETGVDYCFVLDFTKEMAALSASEFMREVLQRQFHVVALLIGYDHRFGHNREEGFDDYRRHGETMGMDVLLAESLEAGRYEVSSSAVRRYLSQGDVRKATFALGREYAVEGLVEGGFHVGRTIGFPTANLRPADSHKLVPLNGVYAVRVCMGRKEYKGMLNIGIRPTLDNGTNRTIEAHILDFDGDIYGETVELRFTEFLRSEKKFADIGQLTAQLRADERRVRTLYFVEANEGGDAREAAIKAANDGRVDAAFAVSQIQGREIARLKVPEWSCVEGIVYPPHLSLEQCSSQATARFKASLFAGDSMADLTGGMGVDCYYLSERFARAVYVERDKTLCALFERNKHLLNVSNIEVINAEAEAYLAAMSPVDLIYIDPARRGAQGGKKVLIADCSPDVLAIKQQLLAKGRMVAVKFSPMLDLSAAISDLGCVRKAYVLALNNECKELLLLLEEGGTDDPEIVCVNIGKPQDARFSFCRSEEAEASVHLADSPAAFLYEPYAAVLKGGAFKLAGSRFHLQKLAPSSHLYTSDEAIEGFPGVCYEVRDIYGVGKKDLAKLKAACPQANIKVRNYPISAEELRARLRIKDGGDDFLFFTTCGAHKKMVIHCRRPSAERDTSKN